MKHEVLTPDSRSDAGKAKGSTGHHRVARRSLVTGGAGFIGSHLVDLLLARGDVVTVVDDLSTGRRTNLPASHERLRFIESGVRAALADLASDDFDEAYHLAAAVGVELVVRDPIRSIETNVFETAALFEFLRRRADAGVLIPTLLASSSEVYGKSVRTPFAEEDDVVYGPTTVGRWSYAASKAIDEYLALASHRMHGTPIVIARFFNTVGPRQTGRYGMVLPRFVRAAVAGEPLPIHGDGRQTRCFCDVRDVVRVLPRMLAAPECHGRVFNVGSDRRISIGALADLVIRTTGSRSTKRFIPYDEAYGPGFEDLACREPDLSRIRKTIGFEPEIPLERTILDVAQEQRADLPTNPGGAT